MKYLWVILLLLVLFSRVEAAQHDTLIFQRVDLAQDISIPNITSINKDYDGNVWVTTLDGLYRFDGYEVVKYISNENEGHGLIKNSLFRTHLAADSTFWVAGSYSLYQYDPVSERLLRMTEHDRNSFQDIYDIAYFDMADIDEEHMLVGCKGGLRIYNKSEQQMVQFDSLVTDYKLDRYSTNAHVLLVESDEQDPNIIWLLTKSGLYRFDRRTWQSELMLYDASIPFPDLNDRGFAMVQSDDYIYLLLKYKNLYRYHKKTGNWQAINSLQDEIKPGHIRNIFPSKKGFWLAYVGVGIYQYEEESGQIRKVTTKYDDGTSCYQPSCIYVDASGRMIMVDNNKVLAISIPNEVGVEPESLFTKNLVIEGHRVEDTIKNQRLHHLENHQRSFTIDFGATNRSTNVAEAYSYKLDDGEWIPLSRNQITVEDLSPGHHDLYAQVIRDGQTISGKVKSFHVAPYFYEQRWFLVMTGVGILGIIGVISYLIGLRRKDKKEFDEKMLELEMNALRSQMNPHFLFNSINSIKSYVILKSKDEAADYLTQFAKLIRMILENSRKKYLSLEEEIDMLRLYIIMEQKRLNHSFSFDIAVDEEVSPNFVIAPMLIQPYIENAIWHGLMNKKGDKHLSLQVKATDSGIRVDVMDNGVGRVASRKYNAENRTSKKSLGLKITEDRIDIIRQMYKIDASVEVIDQYDEAGEASGTVVQIFLPYIDTSKLA